MSATIADTPTDIADDVRSLNLGAKVRRLRQKQQLTLQNISDRTGLSKALLSQIENNLASPPIATLLKISKALGVTIGHFFQESSPARRLALVRRGERRGPIRRGHHEGVDVSYSYQSLAHPMRDKLMEPFIIALNPIPESALRHFNHRGEEFIHVLEGAVEFRGDGETFVLEAGDSIYFDAGISHALRAARGEKAKAVVVVHSD